MRTLLLNLGLVITGALAGCSEPTGTGSADSGPRISMSPLDAIDPAVVYSNEYTWSQGQGDTFMGTSSGRVCFLTRIQGDFEGASESVQVVADSSGFWWLTGGSNQTGVGARARCIQVKQYSQEYAWAHGQAPVPMGTKSGRACFLTRLSGDFEGGGESAVITVSSGNWFLQGNSAHNGVWAGARCVPVASSALYSWSQGQAPTPMGGSFGRVCFFTRVAGRFEGATEMVRVAHPRATLNWVLTGSSTEQGVSAKARCVQ